MFPHTNATTWHT